MLKKDQKRKQRIIVVFSMLMLVLLVIVLYRNYRYASFERGFSDVQKIEAGYNGDFRNEKVNATSIKREDFDKLIKDLEDYNKKLLKKVNTTDVQSLAKFINARIAMLKSEKFFKLGDDIGNIGKATDPEGFKCSEINYLLNAAYYFNRSWTHGVNSLLELDDLLSQYKKVPKLHELVGIDKTKTAFYKSDLKEVKHFPLNNMYSLAYYCGYTGGAPAYLRPFELVASPEENKRIVPLERTV